MTDSAKKLSVVMQRTLLDDRWGSVQWEAVGVVPQRDDHPFQPRLIYHDEKRAQWLHPALEVLLFTDQAEFYYANLTSPEPRVFVMWRVQDDIALPVLVTVSYGEAARLMDANEQVDGVPLPADLVPWIAAFVERHYNPEKNRKAGRYATTKGEPGHG